ncbi:MAG: hypothetical protein WCW53_05385 [Syntrophales bacterium]|jgi:hypothetical protein
MEYSEKINRLKVILENSKILAAQKDDPVCESTGDDVLALVVDALTYLEPENYEKYERELGLWEA